MIAIKCGKLYTITNGIMKNGVILIDNGKIIEVGENVSIPAGAEIIDAAYSEVMPGMVDAHTHLGVFSDGVGLGEEDGNEMTDPVTPHLRALDGIDPADPTFKLCMESGITTVMIAPGSANAIGGMCSVLKTYSGTVEEMAIVKDAGMKMALGENPKRVYGAQKKTPMTRMGIAGLIRENLYKAKLYGEKKAEAEAKGESFKEFDFRMEALQNVVKREVRARIHCHKANDIMTAIRIGDEFNLDFTLEHCTEGDMVMEEIAKRNIPVVLSPLMHPRNKIETRNRNFEIAGKLAGRGILVAVSTDGFSLNAKFLELNAGLCIRHGMKEEDAFKAVTINAAKALGIEKRVGSIEKGKDADFLITSGHPFETRTKVEHVIINGKKAYSLK